MSGVEDTHPVATGRFMVSGKNSTQLDEQARRIAAEFADGRPHSVEIDASSVMNGRGEHLSWQADCTVTVWYPLHGNVHRDP